MKTGVTLVLFMLIGLSAWGENSNPYDQHINRDIKALSHSDIENYLVGHGMGLAKAAELNHYPGPKHVLDLASPLDLTEDQIRKTKALYLRMKAEAIRLGRELVEQEKILDRMFASNEVDETALKAQLDAIAGIKSQLRFIHLNTHLRQKLILTRHQVVKYDELRGYATRHSHKHSSH